MTPLRGKALLPRQWVGRTAPADLHVTGATDGARPEAMKSRKVQNIRARLLGQRSGARLP